MNQKDLRRFRRDLRRFERITNAQLRDCCARVTLPQCLVLLEVDENDRLSVGQLASRLRLDNSTLSRTIDTLVKKGLLDRQRDEEDRRVVWVRLTAEGDSVCNAIHEENDELYRRVFDRIPAAEHDTVRRSFETLVQALLDCESEAPPAGCCDPQETPAPTQAKRKER